MNENIHLTEILKDCPKGWKFYSSVYGDVEFVEILPNIPFPKMSQENGLYLLKTLMLELPIRLKADFFEYGISSAGEHRKGVGECTLFPSRDQRDWSKFTAPWYKKEKFDPKTLKAFDRVLVRLTKDCIWNATFFSHYDKEVNWGCYPCVTTSCKSYDKCIPYNDETKHLLGTSDEAPEYYRYWED